MKYMIHDLEVQNHLSSKRFCNPWDDRNYVVARGWKIQGQSKCSYEYYTSKDAKSSHNCDSPYKFNIPFIPNEVSLLVGHNLKFDLLFDWKHPNLKSFFKRGGRIWDTQYAEYLLNGARQEFHMVAMDTICEKYGGKKKLDIVKALWEMGHLTSEIDQDMLIDYLVGTEEEGRNGGDIGNTELIFLGQIKRASELGMLHTIQARMDGLLCTTEMEYNGLKIDVQEAGRRLKYLEGELSAIDTELQQYIPELPDGFIFNWNSNQHCSAIVFGGTIKYSKVDTYIDSKTGELARKQAVEEVQDGFYTSGKRKGEPRIRKVPCQGELKTKKQEFMFEFQGYTTPDKKWATASTDALGYPIYSTIGEVIEELKDRDIPFLNLLSKRNDLTKDLGTYYVRYDSKTNDYKGMLTCVDRDTHLIHHNLNHTKTVTTRLSSDNPNLQNIPTEGTSEVKRMFCSRFLNGKMLELDYKQLEIVGQALLSNDQNMIKDILDKVDFHCKRVAKLKGVDYTTALYRCTDSSYEHYKEWHRIRTDAKVFSFQRAYGAGAAKIADTTGMAIDTVKDLIEAEELMYPELVDYNLRVQKEVEQSAVPFKDPIRGWKVYRRGMYTAPTGTRYCFRTYDAPAFLQKKGIHDSFKPTELKNYPVQGTSGECVQIALGKLWRHFLSNDNYNGRALLCNTVHDCVWIDTKSEILMEVAADAKRLLEGIPQYLEEIFGIVSPVPFPVEAEAGENLFTKEPIHFN